MVAPGQGRGQRAVAIVCCHHPGHPGHRRGSPAGRRTAYPAGGVGAGPRHDRGGCGCWPGTLGGRQPDGGSAAARNDDHPDPPRARPLVCGQVADSPVGQHRGDLAQALNLDPVGQGGRPSSACKFVHVGLANHAGPDGTGGWAGKFLDDSDQDCKESVSDGSRRCDDTQCCHQRHSRRRG